MLRVTFRCFMLTAVSLTLSLTACDMVHTPSKGSSVDFSNGPQVGVLNVTELVAGIPESPARVTAVTASQGSESSTPNGKNYRLANVGTNVLTWTVSSDVLWLTISDNGGVLPPDGIVDVTILLDHARIGYLEPGVHVAELHFTPITQPASPETVVFWELTVEASDGDLDAGGDSHGSGDVVEPDSGPDVPSNDTFAPDSGPDAPDDNEDEDITDDAPPSDTGPDGAPSEPPPSVGIIALYNFDDAEGDVVRDTSGLEPALDLTIEALSNTSWLPGALRLNSATRVVSNGPATRVYDAITATGEVTVEAWITPSNVTQGGPARVVTLSDGSYHRNLTLGQGLPQGQSPELYNVRMRSSENGVDDPAKADNGLPHVATPIGVASTQLQHVVFTRSSDGTARMFVDGSPSADAIMGGDLSNWNADYLLALGNELGADRPWLGTFHRVVLHDRALSEVEVFQSWEAGAGDGSAAVVDVEPAEGWSVFASLEDPLDSLTTMYTVTNSGTESMVWSMDATDAVKWLRADGQPLPATGVLEPGQKADVMVSIDPEAASESGPGTHSATLHVTNVTSGFGDTALPITLTLSETLDGAWSGEKPGPDNTGPYDVTSLQPSGSLTITEDGVTIENVDISGGITVEASDVTIRNFRIDCGVWTYYGIHVKPASQNVLIEDGEITRCLSAGLYGHNFTARRLEIHEMEADAVKARNNTILEGSWIHHLGLGDGAHADGNQTRGGSNVLIRGNFFDMPVGIPGGYKSNATNIIQAGLGPVSNVVIDSNWLNGGNATVYFRADEGYPLSDCKLINNRFGRDYQYMVLSTGGDVSNLQIHGNVWDDTGEWMDINDSP